MKSLGLIIFLLNSASALANRPLDCAPVVARKIHSAMSAMGASMYAPGRYTFLRSTCGVAENGLYCLGRDMDERLQDPVYEQHARNYQQGIAECGVPRDSTGRWQTGESAAAQIPKRPAEFFHLHKCLREGPNQLRLDLKGGQLNLKSGRTLK